VMLKGVSLVILVLFVIVKCKRFGFLRLLLLKRTIESFAGYFKLKSLDHKKLSKDFWMMLGFWCNSHGVYVNIA
jgi:hypothetical protein